MLVGDSCSALEGRYNNFGVLGLRGYNNFGILGLVCCYECVSASIVIAVFRMLVGDSCAALEGMTILGFKVMMN